MKLAHNIEISVFCKEEDNEDEIINAIHELIPLDFEKEKIQLKKQSVELFEDKTMKIITVFLKKETNTARFLKNIISRLSQDQKDLLKKQLDSRLDNKLHFYIRLDKKKLLNNEYILTDSGDCFHINICIAAYPHKRSAAVKVIKKIIES